MHRMLFRPLAKVPILFLFAGVLLCGCTTANLKQAAVKGKLGDAKKHLTQGADIDARGANSATPLIEAAYHGNTEMVKFLLDQGADPNIANQYGVTSLHFSVGKGYLKITRLLLEGGADPDCKSQKGYSPLIGGSFNDRYETVRLLLEHGADPDIQNNHGVTPLHWAAQKGLTDIAELLIQSGADPDIRNKKGWTPALTAVKNRRKKMVELLLAHDADFRIPDKRGATPLTAAKQLKFDAVFIQKINKTVKKQAAAEANAWHMVERKSTIEGYQEFMAAYPHSKHHDAAQNKRDFLKEKKRSRIEMGQYNRATTLEREGIRRFLEIIRHALLPFTIEKLASGQYNHEFPKAGSGMAYKMTAASGGSIEYSHASLFIPKTGELLTAVSGQRMEDGKEISISISMQWEGEKVNELVASKKEGFVQVIDLSKGNVGQKMFHIRKPARWPVKSLNDFKRIEVFIPEALKGEYINDGSGNWRKI